MSLSLMRIKYFLPASVFLFLLLFWEVGVRYFSDYAFILPPPSAIAHRLFEKWDRFLFHTRITFIEMMGGIFFAFTAAFPLAWFMWMRSSARSILQPLFVFIQCIPMFTLAPIMVFWFGWSYTAIVVPTALMIFFPLTINIYQGLKSVPQSLLDYFKLNEATKWQLFTKLQLPWAVPHIFGGLRISTAIAGIGAVAGEWAGAQNGLGILMIESRRAADLTTTFGAIFCISALSLSIYSITVFFERRVMMARGWSNIAKSVVIFLTMCLFQACQPQGETKQTRLLLDWLPNPSHVPLYVGIKKGFFSEEGIDITILKLQDPSDTVPMLTSRQADIVLFYMPDVIRAKYRGAPLKNVGIIFKQPLNSIIYRADKGIASVEDLNGKRIGYCVDGTDTITLNHVLEKNTIVPSVKRNVSFDLVASLGADRVDALYGAYWNIECEHLRSLGVEVEYFDLRTLGLPNYYELIAIAREETAYAEDAFILKFQKALQLAIDYSKQYPIEAFQMYRSANLDKSEGTLAWELEAWKRTVSVLAKDQQFNQEEWEVYADWMNQHGLLGD